MYLCQGVFTELISSIGVNGVQVEEVFSLDAESWTELEPIHGLIFLFKCSEEKRNINFYEGNDIFFAKQVINNACATQAILSILLNSPQIELGKELSEFKEFTKTFTPQMRGMAISNYETLKKSHNSFAKNDLFVFDRKKSSQKEEDSFHFVSYLPVNGILMEFDGLQEGPINHGAIEGNWLEMASSIITSRIAAFGSELRFSLMAVVRNRRDLYMEQLEIMKDDEAACEEIQQKIMMEEMKMQDYSKENSRRKHNFLPLIMEMLAAYEEAGLDKK